MDNKNIQECNVDDSEKTQKTPKNKARWIVGRIMRLVFPVLYPFINYYSLVFIDFLVSYIGLLGGYALGILRMIFMIVAFVTYGISVAKHEKRKYIFALYFPVMAAISYNIFNSKTSENSIITIILVDVIYSRSIAFWTLISVWIYNRKQKRIFK